MIDGDTTRPLPAGTVVADGTTYWFSALFQSVDDIGQAWVGCFGYDTNWVTEPAAFGGWGFWVGSWMGGGDELEIVPDDPSGVHWMVFKFDTTAGGDITIYAWLDPDPGPEPSIGTAEGSCAGGNFGQFLWLGGAYGDENDFFLIDEIRAGTEWTDVTYDVRLASNPSPYKGEVNVDPALALLEWDAPTEVCTPLYDVYFGKDPDLVTDVNQLEDNTANTSTDPTPVGDMAIDTQYYWRVDVNDPNCDAQCQNCVPGYVMLTGDTWNFRTWPYEPIILTQPETNLVSPGGTAQFEVVSGGNLAGSHTFSWYKQVGATQDEPNDIVMKGPTGPAGSDILTITNVQYNPDPLVSDEGSYYCKVTNTVPGTTYSDSAGLGILRLMAWYRFQANWSDSASNYTATNAGAGIATGGIQGYCANFNGSTAYAYVPFIIAESVGTLEDFTIAAWVKPDIGEEDGVIWAGYDDDTPTGPPPWGPTGGEGISIERTDNGRALVQIVGNSPETISVANAIPEDQWTYVVFVYDSNDASIGTGTLYINGEQAGQVEYDGASAQQVGPFSIGAYKPDGYPAKRFYDGKLDEVRIYAYAITAVNVASLYNEMETSEKPCSGNPVADQDDSCAVDLKDYAKVLSNWLASNIVQ